MIYIVYMISTILLRAHKHSAAAVLERKGKKERKQKRSGIEVHLASIIFFIAVHMVLWFKFITEKILR